MRFFPGLFLILLSAGAVLAQPSLDDREGGPGEWGFHPGDGQTVRLNPPAFTWRVQKAAERYNLEVAAGATRFKFGDLDLPVYCPPVPFQPGQYQWRFRYLDKNGALSSWSGWREFKVEAGTPAFPLPNRGDLLARVPQDHPRLFVRPADRERLATLAGGDRASSFARLKRSCDKLVKNPPPTKEPERYPEGMTYKSEGWRELWWGNRKKTVAVLESAATLAFVDWVEPNPEYRTLARRLLMEAASWDPNGATGYRYNDEAGMPYAYHFSRAYTFLNAHLSEKERATCRKIMTFRGRQMYEHLCPRHLWWPYSSHSNRAWHFLGEVGIAFLGEIPEASDWVWFAANVFRCVYPVWSDADGGWHEGMSYWRSYIGRFTWWADVQKTALGIDAYKKPYFSQVGYYPLYMQPPGHKGGGFGDLTARLVSRSNVPLMSVFAAQAKNPHWQWYVDAHGGAKPQGGYVGFLRGSLPEVKSEPPTDLPSSRLFCGTGQAVLNNTLMDAGKNIQVIFKSSPFGTQSHGYEAQNAFLVNAFGERLLIRSGYRDLYGSAHHKDWMWSTRSVNSVTVNGGEGQKKRNRHARGDILEFSASDRIDFVSGEAGRAYETPLHRFTRRLLFVKPDLIVIFDTIESDEPSTFEWWLHATEPMAIDGATVTVRGKKVSAAKVRFLLPENVLLSQTDKFDPPPRPRIKLVQHHLTAVAGEKTRHVDFVTVIRPFKQGDEPPADGQLTPCQGGLALVTKAGEDPVIVLVRTGEGKLEVNSFSTEKRMAAKLFLSGKKIRTFESEESVDEGF